MGTLSHKKDNVPVGINRKDPHSRQTSTGLLRIELNDY
jgi:hypothetical protein